MTRAENKCIDFPVKRAYNTPFHTILILKKSIIFTNENVVIFVTIKCVIKLLSIVGGGKTLLLRRNI